MAFFSVIKRNFISVVVNFVSFDDKTKRNVFIYIRASRIVNVNSATSKARFPTIIIYFALFDSYIIGAISTNSGTSTIRYIAINNFNMVCNFTFVCIRIFRSNGDATSVVVPVNFSFWIVTASGLF